MIKKNKHLNHFLQIKTEKYLKQVFQVIMQITLKHLYLMKNLTFSNKNGKCTKL